MVHLGRHGNGKSRDVKRNSVKGRLGFSGEVAQAWGRARVSWAGLFMSVDVLGIFGEVNQSPNQPQTGVSWARLFMCVDVLGILGEVNQSQNQLQKGTHIDPKSAPPKTAPRRPKTAPKRVSKSFENACQK